MDSDLDKDNVHGWLVGLDEGLPLDGQWTLHNPGDPVEELYRNVNKTSGEDLTIWIGVAMLLTLVCLVLVVLTAMGKIYKWEPGYGMDFDLWQITKGTLVKIYQRFSEKRLNIAADASNYEEAIDRFGIVRIYEGGKRIEELPSPAIKSLQSLNSDEPDKVQHIGNGRNSSDALNKEMAPRSPSPTHVNQQTYGWKGDTNAILRNIVAKFGFNRNKNQHQSERLKNIRAYQNRPLPSVTEQCSPLTSKQKFSDSQHNSPFLKTNIFTPSNKLPADKRTWIQKFGKSKQVDDFKTVEQILLRNSVEKINSLHHSPDRIDAIKNNKNKNSFSDLMKNKTMPLKKKVCTPEEIDSRSYRSKSMDDGYDVSTRRRENILNYDRRNSHSDHITINEIYAALSDNDDAPVGTYGTWEKDGYLQLPYTKHARPLSSEIGTGITLNEEDIKRICSITDDTNPYYSIKSRLSEGNVYASIKGKGFILNIPCDTNLYDSIKGVPLVAPIDNKHTYAEVFEKTPNSEEVIVDVRHRPIPRPSEINPNSHTDEDLLSHTEIGKGNSIHKYERIENIKTNKEKIEKNLNENENKINEIRQLQRHSAEISTQNKGYTGIYMKFGEVLHTKI